MSYDFSSLFTPHRMQQGADAVKFINYMPWMFHGYYPPNQQPDSAAAPAAPAGLVGQATSPMSDPMTAPLAGTTLTPLQQLTGLGLGAQAPGILAAAAAQANGANGGATPNQGVDNFDPAAFWRMMLGEPNGGGG